MSAKRTKRKTEYEVNLQTLLSAVIQKLWLIGIVSVLCAILVFMGTYMFVSPKYQSYSVFYVNNSVAVGDDISIDSGDISASKSLVDSYLVILLTRQTLTDVIDYAGVELDYLELRDMITAVSMNNTEVVRVTVTATDADVAYKLASAIEYVLPNRISEAIEGSSAKVVDTAMVSYAQVGPDYSFNAAIGFILGAMLTIGIIVLRTAMNTKITSEEEITHSCDYPILAAVPNMNVVSRGGYYGYGQKKQSITDRVGNILRRQNLLGPDISFAASEAYKLLRTKILFSFADGKRCRVIGVSSALAGEGKSLSAVNLAYSLSQMEKKVLLIDCDLRRPSVAAKLGIQRDPGLSNYLTFQSELEEVIQPCGIPNEENAFQVIASGLIPPNPVELLSSQRMSNLLQMLRQEYDYVLLDFPPVGEVSDALSMAKVIDGALLIVRQNYCDRNVFYNVVRQFGYMQAKVLGVVYNCANDGNGLYKKYYYKYRNSKYEASYEENIRKSYKADPKSSGKRTK